jgi:hypothetical protein
MRITIIVVATLAGTVVFAEVHSETDVRSWASLQAEGYQIRQMSLSDGKMFVQKFGSPLYLCIRPPPPSPRIDDERLLCSPAPGPPSFRKTEPAQNP